LQIRQIQKRTVNKWHNIKYNKKSKKDNKGE